MKKRTKASSSNTAGRRASDSRKQTPLRQRNVLAAAAGGGAAPLVTQLPATPKDAFVGARADETANDKAARDKILNKLQKYCADQANSRQANFGQDNDNYETVELSILASTNFGDEMKVASPRFELMRFNQKEAISICGKGRKPPGTTAADFARNCEHAELLAKALFSKGVELQVWT